MKKIHLFTIALVLSCFSYFSQPTFSWAKSIGGSLVDFANKVTTDPSGNVLICGGFSSTGADFDPGPGTFAMSSLGSNDIHVTKLDAAGNFVWAVAVSSANDEQAYGIATDNNGNILVTGYFNGTVDFDPGAGTFNLTSGGSNDIFVLKLSSTGNFIWAVSAGSGSSDYGNQLVCDAAGNVYAVGRFGATVDFDPSASSSNLTSAGGADIFVWKLNSAGALVWIKSMGTSGNDEGKGIALDGTGNVHTTGFFNGLGDFDPGVGTFTMNTTGSTDIFVSKLDNNGNFIWAVQMGGTSSDVGESVKVDGSGNVISGGTIAGMADMDPGNGTFNLTPSGLTGNYISKLTSSGAFVWAKNFTGGSLVTTKDVDVDANGSVYSTGQFNGTTDFDPNAGSVTLAAVGAYDGYISVLTSSGNYSWAGKISGTGQDLPSGIRVTASAIYATGFYNQTTDFDASASTFSITSSGSDDMFVVKYNNCSGAPATPGAISGPAVICGMGGSGTYCISPVAGASSYSWTLSGGITGSSTGNVITVTVNASTGTISVSAMNACGTSAAQTMTLMTEVITATVLTQNICCNAMCTGAATILVSGGTPPYTYTWMPSGNSYTVDNLCTGNYSVSYGSGSGCTYVKTFTITQPAPLTATVTASNSTICSGACASLSASGSGGMGQYTYSWSPVNSTSISVMVCPTVSTTYTLVLKDSCCSVTVLKAITVATCSGLSEQTPNRSFDIYPNPAKGHFIIRTNDLKISTGRIYNVIGEEVMNFAIVKEQTEIEVTNLSKGIYFVKVGDNVKRIVLE